MSHGVWHNAIIMATTQRNKLDRVVRVPGLMGGRPVIKGTRIPIDLILERLAYDLDLKTLVEDYPDLTEEDIKACIAYAKELVEDEEAFPTNEGNVTQAHV